MKEWSRTHYVKKKRKRKTICAHGRTRWGVKRCRICATEYQRKYNRNTVTRASTVERDVPRADRGDKALRAEWEQKLINHGLSMTKGWLPILDPGGVQTQYVVVESNPLQPVAKGKRKQ